VFPARILSHDNQELSHLTNSFAQLKQAQAKFRSCIESAKEVKRENKGTSSTYLRVWRARTRLTIFRDKTVLVPLTSSLYVPGKLRDVENVIIDVGTGYYVQKVRGRAILLTCGTIHTVPTAALDTGAGGEVLRGKDRLYQDEFGRAAGDDREEARQHVLSPHRHPIKAPAIQQQALSYYLVFLSCHCNYTLS
jgi:hypothetical protein